MMPNTSASPRGSAPELKPGYRQGRHDGQILNGWNEKAHRKRKKRKELRKGTGEALTKKERLKDYKRFVYVRGYDDDGKEIIASDWKRVEALQNSWGSDCTYNNTVQRRVLLYVVGKVDHKPGSPMYGHTGKYTPTQSRIASDLGIKLRAVKDALRALKRAGKLNWSVQHTYNRVNGCIVKKSRVTDYWLCCGSMADYEQEIQGTPRGAILPVTGNPHPRLTGSIHPRVTGYSHPIPNTPILPKNIDATLREKQKTAK